jgi:type VI secretion system protein ImpG
MRDELLAYYQDELAFLHQMGAQFAEKYPKIASRLALEPHRAEDPHVERLLEGFAFLAARIHLKIDDEFPEITQALISILYPHYLRPIPSMTIAEFQIDPEQSTPPDGLKIQRESVARTRPIDGMPLRFRTAYDVTLWPIVVAEAQWTTPDRLRPVVRASDSVSALRLVVRTTGAATFDKLRLGSLRFYLNGESELVHTLYELLCSRCNQIIVRDPSQHSTVPPIVIEPRQLKPVGFADDQAVLPYPTRSFSGYRLLQEYFCFPEKFLFLQLEGLNGLAEAGFKDTAEIIFFISPFQRRDRQQTLESGVTKSTFRLGCSPIVNLFTQTAEPILVSQTRYEYPVVPDVSHPDLTEVFSVDEVVSVDPRYPDPIEFLPFFSHRYNSERSKGKAFWHTALRHSSRPKGDRLDAFISLMDGLGRPIAPNVEVLTLRTTCTNGDLPTRIPYGSEKGDLEFEGAAPVKRLTILRKPSNTVRPPVGSDFNWRLVSHLSLNYLSLVERKDAFQNILRLYNFNESAHTEKQILGIHELHSSRQFARVHSEHGISFARGTRVELKLDEDQFVGAGVYLFASVLERFLGLYVSVNSFCELKATTIQRNEPLRHWQPRAGQRILL